MSLDALGAGLALLAVALLVARCTRRRGDAPTDETVEIGGKYRGALLAGAALLFAGFAVYLPMGMVSGRYTMPAVWGLDLMLAVLFSLLCATALVLEKVALVALGGGLVALAVMCIGKQEIRRPRPCFVAGAGVGRAQGAGRRPRGLGQRTGAVR